MKALWICLILGVAGLPCMAAETFSDTHTFGCEGILWESGWNSDFSDVTWAHTLDGFGSNCEITAATLTIDGCGIDNVWGWDTGEQADIVNVSLGGYSLGLLTEGITTFDLVDLGAVDQIGASTLANAEITFQNDSCLDYFFGDVAFLKSSTLSVTCGPVAVPVPGALVLAGLGTVLVGALRRRREIA